MKTSLSMPFVAAAVIASLAACGPQKHENRAPENLARGGERQQLRQACAADIQKYCADADRKRRCLKDNIEKLSDSCRTALSEHRSRGRDRDQEK